MTLSQRLDELERVTKGATQGDWFTDRLVVYSLRGAGTEPVVCTADTPATAEYIAALNPATVAALLVVAKAADAVMAEHPPGWHNHGHEVPGIWDRDNGAKAGTACEQCALVFALRAALAVVHVK